MEHWPAEQRRLFVAVWLTVFVAHAFEPRRPVKQHAREKWSGCGRNALPSKGTESVREEHPGVAASDKRTRDKRTRWKSFSRGHASRSSLKQSGLGDGGEPRKSFYS